MFLLQITNGNTYYTLDGIQSLLAASYKGSGFDIDYIGGNIMFIKESGHDGWIGNIILESGSLTISLDDNRLFDVIIDNLEKMHTLMEGDKSVYMYIIANQLVEPACNIVNKIMALDDLYEVKTKLNMNADIVFCAYFKGE